MTYNNLTSLEVHVVLRSTSRSAVCFLTQYGAAFSLLRQQYRRKEFIRNTEL